jgi:acetyl esterase/lipase
LGIFLGTQQHSETLTSESENEDLLPEITNCTVQYDVPYAQDSNPYHLMNVYLPVGKGPFPAFIYIHGGGWVRGSRGDCNGTAIFYAKRGIAGFAIDYTLTTQGRTAWPENVQDVVEAIRFIRENAQHYQIDSTRIATFGSSAGAQFASFAGTLSGNESFLKGSSGNEEIRSNICLVVDYSGATDFDFIGKNEKTSFIYRILTSALGNVSYSMNPDLWIEASAATYISSDDPPFFIVHGTGDAVIPIEVAESFNAKLQAAGVETHFIKVADGDHDILTSETENLVVRHSLEPLLKRVFNLNQQTVPEFPAPILFPLILTLTLIAVVIFSLSHTRKNCSSLTFPRNSLRGNLALGVLRKERLFQATSLYRLHCTSVSLSGFFKKKTTLPPRGT